MVYVQTSFNLDDIGYSATLPTSKQRGPRPKSSGRPASSGSPGCRRANSASES